MKLNLFNRCDGRLRPFTISVLVIALIATVHFSDRFHTGAQSEIDPSIFAGTISGRVFQDFNGNGLYEITGGTAAAPTAVDVGVAGVTVTVFDAGGVQRGTANTVADGTYSVAATGTGPYRIEFTALPSGYSPSARSTDSVLGGTATNAGSTVQFVADGNTPNANLALDRPKDYCVDNPTICSQLYGLGSANQPDSIFSIPYQAGSTRTTGGNPVTDFMSPGNTSLATTDQVGTTFGIAYNRNSRIVYSAAFMKKHAKFGPGGTGAIYQINRGTGAVSEYVNLNTVFGANTAGANPHNTADYNTDNGQTSWDAAGKVALGGMAISDDMANLFVMNLADRRLYRIPTSGTLNSTTIASSAFPATFIDCTNAVNVRPFAVTYYEGQLYVGAVCSSEQGNNNNRLRMYVLQADPSTLVFNATPVLSQPLDYPRLEVDPGVPAAWNDWATNFTNLPNQGNFSYPQPVFTDVDFDRGNMIISLRDRMGDQTGYFNASDPNNPANLQKGITGGEILRACGNPSLGWTLESNGRCDGIGAAPQNSGEGPGNGEYYYQENYHPNGNPHDEVGNGAAHQIPGHNVMVATIMDPVYLPNDNIYDTGGFRWFVNSVGSQNRGYLAYAAGDFGKANGIGNVTALCEAAPIELGNRIWRDTNGNGVQDPGEPGIAAVTVHLYNSSNSLIATAVTDANGEYYFVSGSAPDGDTTDNIGIVNGQVLRATAYQIRMDRPTDYASGNPLFGLSATTANQTSQLGDDDSSDSDSLPVNNPIGSPAGTYPVISITTGSAGSNNHTSDGGFRLSPSAAGVSIAGRVMTSGSNGIRNAVISLTEADGTVHTAITGAFGYYRFDDISTGQTVVLTVGSKRFTFAEPSILVNVGEDVWNVNFVAEN